ncbi:16239_t:CDS:2 [Entrophospora sp. SA101]|nr:16239_t:CDS:2 [Entrophospora sp. SA101]
MPHEIIEGLAEPEAVALENIVSLAIELSNETISVGSDNEDLESFNMTNFLETNFINGFIIPINQELDGIPLIGITVGHKNVGKSSFSKYLLNRLLNVCPKVAYLETDIGQSEFTPEGILSLNIIESPILEIHNLPAFPTDLISSLKMTNESTALKIIKLEFFDNSTISNKRYTSSDYRTLNMVFYFHGNYNNGTQDDGNDEWWQFRKPLVRHLPWCLNWKRCLTKGVMLMSEEIPPKYNLKRSTLPSPTEHQCLGLAIIRSIDPTNHTFHILTPLPPTILFKTNAIMKGNLELPIWSRSSKGVMVSFGVCGIPWNKLPYMSVEAGEGVGSTARNNRRYLKRRQYS